MYRDKLKNDTHLGDEIIENNDIITSYIEKDKVEKVLDDIESRVNDIKSGLNSIKGLVEIDEIKELLETLSKDLY